MEALSANLRPLLQPITRSLPDPIVNLGISTLGPVCYTTLVADINLADTACLRLALSKGLGLAIVSASSIVKLPQILKLLSSKSASGISFLSYLLETSAFLIGLAYNVRQQFPFSTYGENAFMAIQNVVISVLVLNYSGKSAGAAVFVAGLAAAGYALFKEDIVNQEMLGYALAGAGILGTSSKLPQILTIWKEGGTGQLSAFTVGLDSRLIAFQTLSRMAY